MNQKQPNPQQWIALYNWVFPTSTYPRRAWKSELRDAWMRSGAGVTGYSPELQQMRNEFGPTWLERISAQQIDRAALTHRVAVAAAVKVVQS